MASTLYHVTLGKTAPDGTTIPFADPTFPGILASQGAASLGRIMVFADRADPDADSPLVTFAFTTTTSDGADTTLQITAGGYKMRNLVLTDGDVSALTDAACVQVRIGIAG